MRIELADSGVVTLSVTDNPAAWAQTRLIVLERSTTAHLTAAEALVLQWWEFAPLLSFLRMLPQVHRNLKIEVDDKTRALIKRYQDSAQLIASVRGTGKISESEIVTRLQELGFARSLTAQQLRNVSELYAMPHGATFSVPGAGKTTEALALYALKSKLQYNLLVVAPKNAFAAWDEQVKDCLPGFSVTRLTGGRAQINAALAGNPKIAVITYSQLANVADIVQSHLASRPAAVFLDESHKIKGGEHKVWAGAVLSLSHLPEHKLLMSGTPMPNSPDDLIPQIRFLYPHLAGIDDPISTIQRFFVRTTKAELGLPPVESIGVPIPMTDMQARLYSLCAAEVARDAERALRSKDKMLLRAFGRSYLILLQLVSNPSLLAGYAGRFNDPDLIAGIQSDSPKITYVCHRARQLVSEGHKVLIWSSFVQNVEVISQRLADLGADYIHGDVEAGSEEEQDTREYKVARFRDPQSDSRVLVANPAACSEGISLHSICHHAIYLDRNYNAAQFLQSADRIHRLGLPPNQKTYLEFVYCPGTLDESVNRRLKIKIEAMEAALRDNSISLPTHWLDDLDELPDADDVRDLLETLRGNDV